MGEESSEERSMAGLQRKYLREAKEAQEIETT
jgi:hypothetical protein